MVQAHDHWRIHLALSPDGTRVATVSEGNWTVRLWDAATLAPIADLGRHEEEVTCVRFSADGRLVLSGSLDGFLKCWNLQEGRLEFSQRFHASVYDVACSADGQFLAVALADSIQLLHVVVAEGRWRPLEPLRGHESAVWEVEFRSDGRLVSHDGGTIKHWDVRRRGGVEVVAMLEDEIASLAVSPDGRWVAFGDEVGRLRIVEAPGHAERIAFDAHGHRIRTLAFSPDGSVLLSGSDDRTAAMWSVPDGELIRRLDFGRNWVRNALWLPGEQTIVLGGDACEVEFWTVDGRRMETIDLPRSRTGVMALEPGGSTLAVGNHAGQIHLLDVATRRLAATIDTGQKTSGMTFTVDGRQLISGHTDGKTRLWDWRARTLLGTLEAHVSGVSSVDVSPDGRLLVSCGFETEPILWELSTGTSILRLAGGKGYTDGARFSPDGGTIYAKTRLKWLYAWSAPGWSRNADG